MWLSVIIRAMMTWDYLLFDLFALFVVICSDCSLIICDIFPKTEPAISIWQLQGSNINSSGCWQNVSPVMHIVHVLVL